MNILGLKTDLSVSKEEILNALTLDQTKPLFGFKFSGISMSLINLVL